jgi:SpoVK/Ycf46/Vps4 family AAA+-type ATPase
LVGQSESRTRQTIQLAEALSPCILWIDEIDKAFGGISNSTGDSGTSQRVLGTLLTWMQEKSSPVFIVATANNIHALPPELLRKGRFDELFFINLPTYKERKEIFLLHLKRFRPMELRSFDVEQMAEISKEFSGAEIEQAIVEGMYRAFHEQRDVITDDIIAAIKETYPLASTAREQISFMQAWAVQGRARSASGGELTDKSRGKSGNKLDDILTDDIVTTEMVTKSSLQKSIDLTVELSVEKASSKHRPLPLPPLPQIKSNAE